MITIYGSKTHKQFKLVSFTPLLLKAYFLSSENYLGTSEKRFFHFHRHFFIRRPRLFCSTNCKLFFNKWAGNQLKIFIFSPKIEVVRISSLVRFRRLLNASCTVKMHYPSLKTKTKKMHSCLECMITLFNHIGYLPKKLTERLLIVIYFYVPCESWLPNKDRVEMLRLRFGVKTRL